MGNKKMIGAIEAGGTKIVCAVGSTWEEIRDAERFVVPTTSADETMKEVLEWFSAQNRQTPISAIGVASFGPIDFATQSIAHSTPKIAWRGVSWRKAIDEVLPGIAFGYDTDTNAAGVAEWRWGATQGKKVSVYITIGTGIGGGLIIDGEPVHGLLHPEFGHMIVPRRLDDGFAGTCPNHGGCLEGLACGVAVKQRWHRTGGPQFPADHPAWDLESDYLAAAMVNIIMITSAEKIVLGGGVMAVEGLLEKVQKKTHTLLANYIDRPELTEAGLTDYLVAPGLGNASGAVGAFALGLDALTQ